MRSVNVIAFLVASSIGSATFANAASCPKWEAGTRYPWQSDEVMRGDQFAWVYLDVNRAGYPLKCTVGNNNYPDREAGVWVCRQYYLHWRGPPAAASDPATRTLKRLSFVAGYEHDMANRKSRRAWFKEHPDERPECYPEPSRADRMDL